MVLRLYQMLSKVRTHSKHHLLLTRTKASLLSFSLMNASVLQLKKGKSTHIIKVVAHDLCDKNC